MKLDGLFIWNIIIWLYEDSVIWDKVLLNLIGLDNLMGINIECVYDFYMGLVIMLKVVIF